jgi:hypothetical protein
MIPFAGDILRLCEETVGEVHCEERVKMLRESLFSRREGGSAACRVMGHIKAVVPCISFDETLAVGAQHIELLS